MSETFLTHRSGRWAKWAVALLFASAVGYWAEDLRVPPNGGSVFGYTSGTIAAFLMLVLTYLGRRKRHYGSKLGTVKGWTSAHVYLGVALIGLTLLHSGFQVGWNWHTLAFALMLIVCLSGIYGVWAYQHYPALIDRNNLSQTRGALIDQLHHLDQDITGSLTRHDPGVASIVQGAIERTTLPNRWLDTLRGIDHSEVLLPRKGLVSNTNMTALIDYLIEQIEQGAQGDTALNLQSLVGALGERASLISRIKEDLRLVTLTRIWLTIHIPLAFAAVAAVIIHVIAVFLYW
jgi:hypothetical protein